MRLCTGRTAHRGSRGIALLFLDHGTRREWGVSVTPRPLFTPGKDLVPIVQEAGWTPGSVWTSAENLDTTGIRSPVRPARSQSLYRLSYPAHCKIGRWLEIPCATLNSTSFRSCFSLLSLLKYKQSKFTRSCFLWLFLHPSNVGSS